MQGPGRAVADLVAGADGDHPEHPLALGPVQQVLHEGAVAGLEDGERQDEARHQHGAQGEQREPLHAATVTPRAAPRAPVRRDRPVGRVGTLVRWAP